MHFWMCMLACGLACGAALAAETPARLFPQTPPPAKVLDAVDLQKADLDTKLAAITLEGLCNRGPEAVVFLILSESDNFWLGELQRKGYITGVNRMDLDAYFAKYIRKAKCLLVYDPELPASMNIATMMAADQDGFVAAPRDIERFSTMVAGPAIDLRGRWKTNIEAYEWAFAELWPRMNHQLLAVYHPTQANHHLRDYLVAQRVFTFFATGKSSVEDPHGAPEAEKAFAEKVFAATADNTPIIGWWDGGEFDPGLTEYGGVGLSGQYGKLTFGCNWQANMSLLSGVPVNVDAAMERFRARRNELPPPALDSSKIFVSYAVMESGDSPAYWQYIQKTVWDDPARGQIPIAWSIAPALFETQPSVGEWFLDHATDNDLFFMAISGAGYVHPYRDMMQKTPDPEAAWARHLDIIRANMARFDLPDLGLYTDAWRPFPRDKMDPITRRYTEHLPGLRSLLLGMGRDDLPEGFATTYQLGDTVASHVLTRWDPAGTGRSEACNQWLIEDIQRNTPKERPAFMVVHPLSWWYYPSDLVAIQKALGGEYVAVSPGQLVALWKQAHPLKTAKEQAHE